MSAEAFSRKARDTILVIEDDEMMRQALSESLAEAGFEVILAVNGTEGLKTAREKMPALILLDNRMPEMSGFEMLKRLREGSPWGEQVPVIFFSNLEPASREERSDIESVGAAYYLLKVNTSMDTLITKIKEILKTQK